MQEFIEIPATKSSLKKRTLLYGVGLNDASYITHHEVKGGSKSRCPYYVKWANIMERSYCKKYQDKQPTYKGCSVSPAWHTFSVFKEWMKTQDWIGKELDKDILIKGNKEYRAAACVFVSRQVNALLVCSEKYASRLPQGVSLAGNSNRYRARVNFGGREKHLGIFKTVIEAEIARNTYKAGLILAIANSKEVLKNNKLRIALTERAKDMKTEFFSQAG